MLRRSFPVTVIGREESLAFPVVFGTEVPPVHVKGLKVIGPALDLSTVQHGGEPAQRQAWQLPGPDDVCTTVDTRVADRDSVSDGHAVKHLGVANGFAV